MKNYYYILGVPSHASEQDIRAAYKKLAAKFHPDNNGGDAFFKEHFKEIQEAFDTLAQPQKRSAYDQAFLSPKERSGGSDGTRPIIQQFETSKTAISEGELITVSWEVANADAVEINAIGKVANKGTKTLRLGQMHLHAQIGVVIRARNATSQQPTEKTIWIKNKSFVEQPLPLQQTAPVNRKPVFEEREEMPKRFIEESDDDLADTPRRRSLQNQEKTDKKEPKNDFYVYFIVVIILLLTAVLGYIVFQMNGL